MMRQLKYNDNFSDTIDDNVDFWKTVEDIPKDIIDGINEESNSIPIYLSLEKKFYCSSCLIPLDDNHTCPKCNRYYDKKRDTKNIFSKSFKDLTHEVFYYYVFDVSFGETFLYLIRNEVIFSHPFIVTKYKSSTIEIENAYLIQEKGLLELFTNKFYSFDNLKKDYELEKENPNTFYATEIHSFFSDIRGDNYIIYTKNLEILKKSPLYKYSRLWDMKKELEEGFIALSSITYNPIYCKEFEYLVKMKLYNLALDCHEGNYEYQGSFKKTFGFDKKYYDFMVKNNISSFELRALKLYPTEDYELLQFMSNGFYSGIKELVEILDFNELKKYFDKQNLKDYHINDYCDYIDFCKKLSLNLKDKKVLFPKDFMDAHDSLATEAMITENPDIDKKINDLSNILSLNIFEDDKFIIFPADSVTSLINESTQQSNCVRTYCEKMSNNDCQIYFMRYKDSKDKSLVTVEVRDGKVVQARTRFNGNINDEMDKFLKKWEKQMIPILKVKEN